MKKNQKSTLYICLVGLVIIASILVYTGSANCISKWIHGNSEFPSTSGKSNSSSSTNQPNADSHIIPASQLDSYLRNSSNSVNTDAYDYSIMHATTNNYAISIDNIQIKNFNSLNPDYVDYNSMEYRSSAPDIQEIHPQPKYIQSPLTLCEFKIENTCNNYIYPSLIRATVVYDNGTQEETLCGNPYGFNNYEYKQISQYVPMPNIPSLAPGAVGNFNLLFQNFDMSKNPVMTLAIIGSFGSNTIRIPLTNN